MSIFDLRQEASPLIISVPHDGALIPDGMLQDMNPEVIDSSDRDYLIGDVFKFEGLSYSRIQANYSRHVIDLNRPASGEALYKNQAETELCPTTTFDFKDIYLPGKRPDDLEVNDRIKKYWLPYHQQLQYLIDAAKKQFGYCLLIDAHSIDDEVPRFFEGQLPDINVGTNDGQSCSRGIEQLLMQQLNNQQVFSCVNNGRFKGGFITRNYGQPKDNVHAIQLEHAKNCYLDEKLKLSSKSIQLSQFWSHCLNKLFKICNEKYR